MNKIKNLLAVLIISIMISGCGMFSSEKQIVTRTKVETPKIVHPSLPSRTRMQDVDFKVFNKDRLESFIEENENIQLIAMSPKGYENLSENMQELKRYIQQLKEIVLFYRRTFEDFEKNIEEINSEKKEKSQ